MFRSHVMCVRALLFLFVSLFSLTCSSLLWANSSSSNRLIINLKNDKEQMSFNESSSIGHIGPYKNSRPKKVDHEDILEGLKTHLKNQQNVQHNHGALNRSQSANVAFEIIQESEKRIIIESDNLGKMDSKILEGFYHHDVHSVEVDQIFTIASFSPYNSPQRVNDQRYFEQWALHSQEAGIGAPEAWELTTGDSSVVVAVVDTGITSHSDLGDRVLPGANLISDARISNNGQTRSNDASDPGDWVDEEDFCYQGSFRPSSWHGTHVAGTIGAKTGNGIGIAGVDWKAQILPVRVLGKCGGYSSDIADGILWAAGLDVSGLEKNPHPADVINLSLGGIGPCSETMQSAIDQANKTGATVVVASGNHGANLNYQNYSPANCRGVLTVAAHNKQAEVTSYSNLGKVVDIVAPGGDHSNGVVSTLNYGSRSPSIESYTKYFGTSMAAPHVSGVVSLIKALNPGLYPAQIRDIIRSSSERILSSQCHLSELSNCGHGRLNAYEALVLADVTQPDENFQGTDPISPAPPHGDSSEMKGIEKSGGCGTIVDISNLPPSGGGSAMALSLSFFLIFIAPLLGKALAFGLPLSILRHGNIINA